MMPVVRISEATWQRLQSHAQPFVDTPESVINLALDALEEAKGAGPGGVGIQAGDHKITATVPTRRSGPKLPQKEFRKPLLETVYELGKSALTNQIRELMATKMASRLHDADYELVSSGDPRWWNAICWERNDLVREGLFRSDSPRGTWELSDKGVALVEKAGEG